MKESTILNSPSQLEVNPSIYLHHYMLACLIIRSGRVEQTEKDLETMMTLIDDGILNVSGDAAYVLETYIEEFKELVRIIKPHISP